jgi:hypothetical protein
MASAGHSSLQVPHMIQSSVILWGIFPPPSNFDFGVKLFYNLIDILVMHQGSEVNRFHTGTRTSKTALAKMLLKNFPGHGIFIEDFSDVHFLVDLSLPFLHASPTSSQLIFSCQKKFIPRPPDPCPAARITTQSPCGKGKDPVPSAMIVLPGLLRPTLSLWITGKMI